MCINETFFHMLYTKSALCIISISYAFKIIYFLLRKKTKKMHDFKIKTRILISFITLLHIITSTKYSSFAYHYYMCNYSTLMPI